MYMYLLPSLSTGSSVASAGKEDRSWLFNASFQPAPQQPVPLSGIRTSPQDDLPPPSKKTKSEGRKHREKEKERKEKEKKSHSKATAVQLKPKTIWFDECGLAPENAYRVDPQADHSNLQYSALYSGDVAAYRRRFGAHCVGLGPHQAIEWTDNRGKKGDKKHREKLHRYFDAGPPQSDSLLYVGPQHQATRDVSTGGSTHAPFFIALEPASRDTSGEEEGPVRGLTPEAYISQQTAAYNRSLQEDPHNVDLWLEFLAFQREASVWSGEPRGAAGKALRAMNERKLAIFERALEHNPTSVELLMGHLELLQEMGRDPETILKQWKNLVFRMPNKPLLWIKYSEFCRMQLTTFSTSSLTALYQKGITTLTAIQEGVMKSHRPEPNTTPHLLALFVQCCHSLAEAGQSEKAVACYQALLEYNLCCPPQLTSTDDSPVTSKQRIAFFEPFWDSGAPRVGENGATGWAQWMQASQGGQAPKSLSLIDARFLPHSGALSVTKGEEQETEEEEEDPELALIATHPLPEAWLLLESHRDQHNALPHRGPEEDLTDPERAVLFEDISQYMFTIPESHLLLRLVLQFLQFLGAPTAGAPALDHLPHLLSSHMQCALDALPAHPGSRTRCAPPPQLQHTCAVYPHRTCGVASGYDAISSSHLLHRLQQEHPPPPPSVCLFISNFCNQVLSLLPDPAAQTIIALVWIGFEVSLVAPALRDLDQAKSKHTKQRVKAIQKLMKYLLKLEGHRNNLSLWDCCCQLELLLVGSKEALAMYESVLSQYTTITPELLPLYQHYCEVLMGLQTPLTPSPSLLQQNFSRALHITMCVADGKHFQKGQDHTTSPSDILRTRRLYQQRVGPESPFSLIICRAYFEYLSKDLQTACKALQQYASAVRSRLATMSLGNQEHCILQAQLSQVYHCQSHLLLWHAECNPMPPSLLWGTLEQALSSFPDDPYLLSRYTDCQQPLYLMGQLRKYFDTHASKAQTAIPWVHAVRAEVSRYHRVLEMSVGGGAGLETSTGLVNRIRAILARATQSSNGRVCPLLWRLAIRFEVRTI